MTLPEQIDVQSLVETYVVSNTPKYLYKELRATLSVQWLARNLPVQRISEIFKEIQRKKEKSVEDLSVAYAALVSLSLKDEPEARSAIQELPPEGFQWAREIKEIATSSVIPTVSMITIMPRILPGLVPQPTAKDHSTTISIYRVSDDH